MQRRLSGNYRGDECELITPAGQKDTMSDLNHQAPPSISSLCAVITPVYKPRLTEDEKTSVASAHKLLQRWPRFYIAPHHLDVDQLPRVDRVERFNDDYFRSTLTYNRLMLSPEFYERFSRFRYVLICQTDCLIFHDSLAHFCQLGYDYIGAPWSGKYRSPMGNVGNGGLSLRNTQSALSILKRGRLTNNIRLNLSFPTQQSHFFMAEMPLRILRFFTPHNNIKFFLSRFNQNEDVFWSRYAHRFVKHFRIPSEDEAVKFAIEGNARYYLSQLGPGKLPFGCHAWWQHDRELWSQYITR